MSGRLFLARGTRDLARGHETSLEDAQSGVFFRWSIFADLCSVVYFRSSQLITTGGWACAGLDPGVFIGFSRLSGRWEQVPKKYQKRPY